MRARRRNTLRRGRNLSDDNIHTIVEILDGWSDRLSWPLLIDEIEKRLGSRYSRQALHKHDRIHHAFQLRKQTAHHQPVVKKPPVSPEMQAALGHLARLEAKNERLEAENQCLLEQFAVWAYNARIRGIDETALHRPLPSIGFH